MRCTRNHVDMLYRVALAEHFTSPTTAATYDRQRAIAELLAAGLIHRLPHGALRLTDGTSEFLDHRLDRERAGILRRVRERHAKKGA